MPLPDLPPWVGGQGEPDIVIDIGAVPPRLDELVVERPFFQASADGRCRYAVPDVASYLINAEASHVTVAPEMDPAAADIRIFLFGTVFGLLCYKRGLLPLHASCVRIGNGAVAFAGQSGIGKSTLAANFVRRGHTVLTDDITVIAPGRADTVQVLPTFPRLKLWGDALDRLDIASAGLENSRVNLTKYHWPVDGAFEATPLPLLAVFHLDPDQPTDGRQLRRLGGPEAMARLVRDLYRRAMMVRLGLSREVLATALPVVAVPGGTWLVSHGHEAGGLERSMSAILDVCARLSERDIA